MKLTIALIAAVAAATTAQAQTATIRHADLDLDSQAGRIELEHRIETALRQVCPTETYTGSRIARSGEQQRCEADVRAQVAERLPH